MNSLTFLYIIYIISIIILLIGVLINAIYILPLQIKQAKVKNGLAGLRIFMLAQGSLNLLVGIFLIIALASRFFTEGDTVRYATATIMFVISIAFFTFTLIWVFMYRQQFTPRQVKLHAKIEKEEKKIEKEEKK